MVKATYDLVKKFTFWSKIHVYPALTVSIVLQRVSCCMASEQTSLQSGRGIL